MEEDLSPAGLQRHMENAFVETVTAEAECYRLAFALFADELGSHELAMVLAPSVLSGVVRKAQFRAERAMREASQDMVLRMELGQHLVDQDSNYSEEDS